MLKSPGMKAGTVGLIVEAQAQSLPTGHNQVNVIKNFSNPICRVCEQKTESIDH